LDHIVDPQDLHPPAFLDSKFFDSRDLLQVKYEMLRRVLLEGQSVSETSAEFGMSRPTYYRARESFEQGGLAGLLSEKRGPRGAHKLTEEVMNFVEQEITKEGRLGASVLAERVEQRFGLSVHPRSIERSLAGLEKKHH
jgi:transposase